MRRNVAFVIVATFAIVGAGCATMPLIQLDRHATVGDASGSVDVVVKHETVSMPMPFLQGEKAPPRVEPKETHAGYVGRELHSRLGPGSDEVVRETVLTIDETGLATGPPLVLQLTTNKVTTSVTPDLTTSLDDTKTAVDLAGAGALVVAMTLSGGAAAFGPQLGLAPSLALYGAAFVALGGQAVATYVSGQVLQPDIIELQSEASSTALASLLDEHAAKLRPRVTTLAGGAR